jgi:hypothetical protein
MAGFGDSNDIKITVALDTKDAVDGVKKLTDEINLFLKRVEAPFKKLGDLSKEVSKVQIADIKAKRDVELQTLQDLDKANQRKHERILERIRAEVAYEKVASNEFIQLEKSRVNESIRINQQRQVTARKLIDDTTKFNIAQTAAQLEGQKSANAKEVKDFSEKEKTKRTEALKTIALTNQETAKIKKGPRIDVGDTAGSGKVIDGLKNSIAALSFQFGNVNVGFGSFINNFKNLGIAGGAIAGVIAAVGAIQKLDKAIDDLAAQANKVEGLTAGFNTLQRTIGQDPTKSIEKLRAATRGLVSDVDLYQRANQAVLLGVPTAVFDEAAAAAVKLGRAMGIDASFGLESLSLGLGRQSRLYLDNLGIIVSAEEAYKNFALSVGKSANDLTDAEKKAAFFAEALKKIKERAEELPEPLDTVGISLQRLQAAQDNANKKFNEGFNASQPLIQAYKDQAKIAETNIALNERFGLATAKLGSIVKDAANVFRAFGTIAKFAFTEVIDVFTDLTTKAEQLKGFETRLQSTEERIRKLTEVRDRLQAQGFTLGNPRFADVDAALQRTQEEAKGLREEIVLLRGEGERGIKINIDNSEVIAARSQISTLFSDLRVEAERQAGIFKVPGIGDPQSAQIFSDLKTAKQEFDNSVQDTTAVEKYTAALNKLEQDVSAAAAKSSFANLAKNVTVFADAASSGKIGQAKEAFNGVKGALTQLSKGAGLTAVDLKALAAGLTGVTKEGKKATKPINDTTKALKRQQQELDQFVKSVQKRTKTAIPPQFEKQLSELFRGAEVGSREFEAGLRAIGQAAQAAGVDLTAFNRLIKAQQDLLEQGVPMDKLPLSADAAEAAAAYNDELARAQEGMFNIRDKIFGAAETTDGKKGGGAFFGFDLGEAATPESEAQAAGAFQDFLGSALQAGIDGFSREDVPALTAQLGGALGSALGAAIGGPAGAQIGQQLGTIIGQIAGESLAELGKDLKGTQERKEIDKYFTEIFDGGRLGVLIQGQIRTAVSNGVVTIGETLEEVKPQIQRISDIVFEGFTPFAGMVRFGGEGFFDYFNTLSASVQNSFTGVGTALGLLLGVSADTAKLIGTAISNNIGGNLQNLQVLIQATGESLETLSEAVVEAFLNAQITIEEAYNSLLQLQNIFEKGIPGAFGAWQEALGNFRTAIKENLPGRYLIDSFRDIASEGIEAGQTFERIGNEVAASLGLSGDQIQLFFLAMKQAGITNLAQLEGASTETLISILAIAKKIKDGIAVTAEDIAKLPIAPTTTAPKTGGGGRRVDPAAELLKKQKEEARKLTQESQQYLKVIKQINEGQLSNIAAGTEIKAINAELLRLIKKRDETEKALNAELDKGAKGSAKTIAKLSAALQKLQEDLDKAKEKAKESERQYKQLDISGIIPLIKSQNTLGLIAEQIGVSLQKNVDILVKGFLQGRLSIAEVNAEIKKTKDLLGPGIPGAVGAVTDAFQNLIDAGTQGGKFSTDAFVDIFAEFREKFNKEGSAFREAQRKQLVANFDAANQAARTAIGPEASKAAQEALAFAKKALEDFRNTPLVPDISDLREQLKSVFSPEQVDLFFQALDESGLKSFEELEGASEAAIVGILGRLSELGFKFGETSDEAKGINKGLQDAETAANAGLDPLQEAINLVKQFNDSAGLLPPVFNSTTTAIGEMEGPLTKVKDKIADTIELLGLLDKNTFENDIVFNIRTTGAQGGEALVNLIFGDGSQTSSDTGNGKKTPPNKETPTKETPSNTNGKRSDWIRQSAGIYKNRKTGRIVKSKTNPGA